MSTLPTRPAAAADDRRHANPVIVIPGLLGSNLVVPGSNRSVWGAFDEGVTDPTSDEGAQLFAFPMEPGRPLEELEARSRVDGTLGVVKGRVAGIPIRVKAYGDVLSAMGVSSYSETFARPGARGDDVAYEFAYDFRRSIDDLACRLEAFMLEATRFLQLQRGNHDPIRFDVVAHSQGGLVLRYLLRYGGQLLPYDGLPRPTWAGAHLVETAIVVGSPSGGAALAIDRLVSGVPGNPVHPAYGPILMGSFPSGYQLLPRTRHDPVAAVDGTLPLDPLEPDFWLARDVGLCASWLGVQRARAMPGVDTAEARRDVAEDHMRKCLRNARFFQAAMDVAMPPKPAHLGLHLFVGDAQKTCARVSIERGERKVSVLELAPGDGTVLRRSALLDEAGDSLDPERVRSPIPWDSVTQLKKGHMGLMSDPILLTALPQLLGRDVG